MTDPEKRRLVCFAQFNQLRVEPAREGVLQFRKHAADSLAWNARFYDWNFFETFCWILEGTFCGYFPIREADVVWTRNVGLLNERVRVYSDSSLAGSDGPLLQELKSRLARREAFAAQDQMPEGREKNLEASLFGRILLLSNRLWSDRLARRCLAVVNFLDEETWRSLTLAVPAPGEVAGYLSNSEIGQAKLTPAMVIAGFSRITEHMAASKEFFEYASRRYAKASADFDAFKARVGTPQAWMLDFENAVVKARFAHLIQLLDLVLQQEASEKAAGVQWSKITNRLQPYLENLGTSWGVDHPMPSYALR